MKNILVIDDDIMFSDMLNYILEKAGHSILTINKSSAAMERLENLSNFDIIILDIMMRRAISMNITDPEMETGEFIYSEIRKINKKIPVLLISAKDKDDININICKKTQYIKKPISDSGREVIASIEELAQ